MRLLFSSCAAGSSARSFLAIFCFLLLLCIPAFAQSRTLTVGSKRFPESEILGEMIAQIATKTGEATVTHKNGLGNTGIVFSALKAGTIDVYPEYTGTISQELLKDKTLKDLPGINAKLAPLGLAAGVPLGFNDGYGLAIRDDLGAKLGVKTIGDLAAHPDLHLGISQEFLKRADGWEGVKAAYGLPFAAPQGFDHGAAYQAIGSRQVDVVDVYTTDAEIKKFGLRVLADNRNYFPRYDAVLLYRSDLPARLPKTWAALQVLDNKISADTMIGLNSEASVQHEKPAAIAAAFLSGTQVKASGKGFLAALVAPDFWLLTGQHLVLVFSSLLLSVLIGVPLGIWAARARSASGAILGITGVIQTIPSLALLAFFVPALGVGWKPAVVALFLYGLLPIVRNTYTGLTDLSPALRESALALGLPPGARLRLVELPLAARSILAGIKTSAVINVGTATIAAFISAGGYGERIYEGLSTFDYDTMLAGAVPAAALALLVQGGFDLLDRVLVPAGLRERS